MSNSNHFVKNIEINHFKCFRDFKADGLKRVNLIGGKNNVGKTAFIEAVFININSQEFSNLCTSIYDVKYMRENINILESPSIDDKKKFMEQSNKIDIATNKNHINFNIKEHNGIKKYIFKYDNKTVNMNTCNCSFAFQYIKNIEFIDNFGLFNGEIISNYAYMQSKDKEYYLDDILKEFDPQIESFKIIGEKPQCKANGEYREITEFGNGVKHLISIIVSLFKTENGYLFVDKIDNGIHYTQLDKLWETIITLASDLNVQLFATTHSKECIDSYIRVNQSIFQTDMTFTALSRLKNGNISAIVRNYDDFTNIAKLK